MLKLLVLVAALVVVVSALPAKESPVNQELVDYINAQGKWKAKLHPRFAEMDIQQLRKLMGTRLRAENPKLKQHKKSSKPAAAAKSHDDIPASFDARDAWPHCKDVISTIADQSSCGSCWAVSAASVMSDRICIATNGTNKTPISSNDILSCCDECGSGCDGGYPMEAFFFWQEKGVVSGSSYKLDQGCKPYPFQECEHHSNKTKYSPCPKDIYDTPKCMKKCQTSYTTHKYKQDKTYAKYVFDLNRDIDGTQREIMQNGPVVFAYNVYSDFMAYDTGVYEHTTGKFLGGHAVRAIGWGTEDGVDYWLIANSWNEDWAGLGGCFKMIRGTNNCSIEKHISVARVDVGRLPAKN